jgi:hypothetical protein
MTAKTKFGLVIITVAFLLLNPIGACASMSAASTPAHPCCPKKPAPPADCPTAGCICAFTPQAPVTVPPNVDTGAAPDLATAAEPVLAFAVESQKTEFVSILVDSHQRYLLVHQFLL